MMLARKNTIRRFFSSFLALILVLGLLPVAAGAASRGGEYIDVEYTSTPIVELQLTVRVVDDKDNLLEEFLVEDALRTASTMTVSLKENYRTYYTISDITLEDGQIGEWSQDFTQDYQVTFTVQSLGTDGEDVMTVRLTEKEISAEENCTVTFHWNLDDEGIYQTVEVPTGESFQSAGITMPDDPTYYNRSFTKWSTKAQSELFDDSDYDFTAETPVINDVDVYARWKLAANASEFHIMDIATSFMPYIHEVLNDDSVAIVDIDRMDVRDSDGNDTTGYMDALNEMRRDPISGTEFWLIQNRTVGLGEVRPEKLSELIVTLKDGRQVTIPIENITQNRVTGSDPVSTPKVVIELRLKDDAGQPVQPKESSYVRFYIEDLNNGEYNLSDIPGTGNLKVDKGFVYLESIQVEGLEGGQTVANVADWMTQHNIKISGSYDTVVELVAAANGQTGNNLDATDYTGFTYTNVTWEGSQSDNAYHVHIKLTEKSNETGTLHISKSVAGLATIPGVPDNYDVTITVTAEGETEPTYTLSKSNADAGTEGHWFEWTLENVPVGEYTVEETAYSNEFRSGDYIYTLEKTERTNDGAVTVTANGESWVAVTNTYGGAYSPVAPTDNLYFSKSVNYTSAKVGDELTYTIQVHNAGSTAAEVTITDKLADGLTYISADNDAEYDATTNTVSWTGTVAANTTLDLKIVAKINDDQADNTITNVATVNNKTTNQVFTEVEAGSTDPDPDPTPTPTPTPTNPPYVPDDDDDDDDDDPPVVIVDPTTPLGPGTSPEPTTEPTTEPTEEPTEIPEETTPLAPDPGVGDNGDGDDGDADITDGETPLGNLPQTGAVAAPVNPATTAGLVALAFSMAGCGLYFAFGRKKGEEED